MRILVNGSGGFLGSHFCVQGIEAGDEVLGTLFRHQGPAFGWKTTVLDITNREEARQCCKAFKPDAIIHCARYGGGVGQCEKERLTAFRVNVMGTANLARCAEESEAFFLYISTDWIFSGTKPLGEKYEEDEEPCPLNYYGVTKWAGEVEVARTRGPWLIVRPANIYGVHASFLLSSNQPMEGTLARSSWLHKMIAKLRQREKIALPDTVVQSPVLADHLAEVSLKLLKQGKTGIYHVAGREGVSRFEFLRKATEVLGLDPNSVLKGTLQDLEKSWGIPEELSGIVPLNAALNVEKVEQTLGIPMLTLSEGISKIKDILLK